MGAVGAAPRPAPTRPFVGRGDELSELHAALRRAAAGQPGMLLVAGEAGVGKSRLIGQFAEHARQAGTLVALGGAAPLTGGALPYAPLVQALQSLAADHEPAAFGGEGAELADVLAELTGDRPAAERSPEMGRARLFERLRRLLGGLTRSAPLVLVLEDLHWADGGSLDVLTFLLRTPHGPGPLVVGSYRDDDPGELLASWLAEMRRLPRVRWLELPRFTRAELAAQVAGLQGGPVDSRVVEEAFDRTQGNPFFAEQLFETGLGTGGLPLLLREVLLSRVRRLSPNGQQLLRVAAVAGRWVGHDWLAAVADAPDDELDSGLAEAVGHGLLMVTPKERAGQEAYEFRHALLQEAVYGELLPGQRARLHGAYASALASAPTGPHAVPQFPAELAEHWYRAHQPTEALTWSVRAADSAERVYAHGEAARHCERALELWDQVPDAAVRAGLDRVGLHIRAARARERAGDEARALWHAEEALRQLDPAADPARAGLLQHLRGWYGIEKADPDAVLAANREAVRLVPSEPPSTARAQALLGYGRVLHVQGRYDEAAAVCEQALTAARRARSQPDIGRAMAGLGCMRAITGEVGAGLALLREACALAEASSAEEGWAETGEFPGDREWQVVRIVDMLLSDALLKTGRLEEAADVAVRGWETLQRLGLADHGNACRLLGCAVEALFGLGHWDQAAHISEPLAHQPVSFANAVVQSKLAELEAASGEPEAALARLDQVRERGWRPGPRHAQDLGQSRAEAQLWLGHPQSALADVTQALNAITGTGQERFAGWLFCLGARSLADLAEQARARQDPAAAAEAQRRGRQLAGRLTETTHHPFAPGTNMPATAAAEQALWDAEHARLDGAADPAAWQAAAAAWQHLGRPYPAAYAQWRHADALLASGAGSDPAAGPLRAAHTAAASLGAAPLRTQLEALARRGRISLAPAGPESAPASARPHGLTEREADVLRLLAAGHTNREIGQHLFISPKTASVHVTSILRKLAVRDRVQAAAIAIRLGLADPAIPRGSDKPPAAGPQQR
jgi:DNA-binding CsgD family transcriptional regulator/tetratricopeptide (TPR) repeat protein